jgi:hypothetical protein
MTRTGWIAVGGVSALAFGLAIALVIALATAGDDDDAAAQPPGLVSPGGAPSDEFQDCMSENGVEPPEPGTLQTQPPAGLEQALEACRHLLPEDAPAPGDGGGFRIAPG